MPMGQTEEVEFTEAEQGYSEPSVDERIEQIKELLDWLYEIEDQIKDKDAWLGIVTSLEEMLKELEGD